MTPTEPTTPTKLAWTAPTVEAIPLTDTENGLPGAQDGHHTLS